MNNSVKDFWSELEVCDELGNIGEVKGFGDKLNIGQLYNHYYM
jgi:hypothetical protein